MKKVTITNSKGVAVATREPSGQWGFVINGQSSGSLYFDDAQMAKNVEAAQKRGDKVEIE